MKHIIPFFKMFEASELFDDSIIGKTIDRIFTDNETYINFICGNTCYCMYGDDDYSTITIDDINGNLDDLVGNPIILAEESVNTELPPPTDKEYHDDSWTWTFYKFATIKGYVDIKWYGESNGYYSESVNFIETEITNYMHPYHCILELFNDESKLELFDDYDIIRGDEINVYRLNDFLTELGKPTITDIKFKSDKIEIIP